MKLRSILSVMMAVALALTAFSGSGTRTPRR